MATYKWRVPIVQAVQFDGKNYEEVKALIGDTSEGEEFLVGTGEFENPEAVEPPPPVEPPPEGETAPTEPPPEEALPPVPPTGVPYDPKAKPPEGPVEIKEPLAVAEGDWVVKWSHDGKIETNPEGFPQEYDFVSI